MEPQTTGQQIKAGTTEESSYAADYPKDDIVNLRLPRKRVGIIDIDVDLSALPKRKPHIVLEKEPEGTE